MWSLKRNDTNELSNQKGLTDLENELTVAREEEREKGIVRVFGMAMCTLLYLKWITNKDLLNSTWNSVQCCVAS